MRGGATVDASWDGGLLREATITGGPVADMRLRMPNGCTAVALNGAAIEACEFVSLHLTPGQKAELTFYYN